MLGSEIVEVNTVSHNNKHQNYLKDSNGIEHGPYDLIVVSDGVNSSLRNYLTKTDPDFEYKSHDFSWGCLWTIVEDFRSEYRETLLQVLNTCSQMAGYMPSGKNQNDENDKFSFFWSIHKKDFEKWNSDEISLDCFKSELLELDPNFSKCLLDQIKTKDQLKFANYKNVKTKNTGKRNIIFIGDSSHATSPVLGQGTNLALRDAQVLAECLSTVDKIPESLSQFIQLTKSHCNYIQNASMALNPVFQSNIPALHLFRDHLTPILTKIPYIKKEALLTQSGIKKSLFSNYPIEDYVSPFEK
jgi:2-polyprenyl-6-methoxyphenol hydroxylase-like FAD-dependent oxidoreductase